MSDHQAYLQLAFTKRDDEPITDNNIVSHVSSAIYGRMGDWGWTKAEVKLTDTTRGPLTISQSILLGDLNHGIERGLKMRYYQYGSRDADHPLVVVLRAFTHEGGGFYPHDKDIREAFVWASGFTERWFQVNHLIKALDNIDGKHGLEEPMAVIDNDKE